MTNSGENLAVDLREVFEPGFEFQCDLLNGYGGETINHRAKLTCVVPKPLMRCALRETVHFGFIKNFIYLWCVPILWIIDRSANNFFSLLSHSDR